MTSPGGEVLPTNFNKAFLISSNWVTLTREELTLLFLLSLEVNARAAGCGASLSVVYKAVTRGVKLHDFSMLEPDVGTLSQLNGVCLSKPLSGLVSAGLLFRNVGQEVVE